VALVAELAGQYGRTCAGFKDPAPFGGNVGTDDSILVHIPPVLFDRFPTYDDISVFFHARLLRGLLFIG
jgi:hypothetical protein